MPYEDDIIDDELTDEDLDEALSQADDENEGFSEEDILEDNADVESPVTGETEAEPKVTKAEEEATVGAVVDFAGALLVKFKHIKTPEGRKQWLQEYHDLVDPFLMMIGFGKALRTMPVSKMNPKTTLFLGVGIMILMGFLVAKPPEPEFPSQKINSQPAPKPHLKQPDMGTVVVANGENNVKKVDNSSETKEGGDVK
jgi:hypothetical protein